MKKKYVLKNKKRFSIFLVVVALLVNALLITNTVYGYKNINHKTITVRYGDTLWEIAGRYNNRGDIRNFIYDIKELNKLDSSDIIEGMELKIPVIE